MLKIKILLGAITTLLFFLNLSFADEIPKLVFEKRLNHLIKHRVKKGECLYLILKSYGIPDKVIPAFIKCIKQYNPHIQDLNKIFPGQVVFLPKLKVKRYKVKKGDYAINLLKRVGNVPKHLIYNEFINFFKMLNPKIKDINNLKVGMVVNLPVLPKKNRFTKKKIKKAEVNKKKHNKFFSLLEKIGFKITTGKKLLLPTKKGTWILVDTSNIFLVNSPWKDNFFILSKKLAPLYIKTLRKLKGKYLLLDFQKDIYELLVSFFKKLENLYPDKFLYWKRKRSVVIFDEDFTLEVKADVQFVVLLDDQKRYYFFFFNKVNSSNNVLWGIREFLKKHNIFISFFKNKLNRFSVENLFIPKLKMESIMENSLKMLNLSLTVLKNSNYVIKIYLEVPALFKKDKLAGLVFFEDEVDPYLVSLLNLKGYKCYAVVKNE